MFDYSFTGAFVETPGGIGQYLDHTADGKVLVVFDYETPPVEYDGDFIETRPGEDKKCLDYCAACEFCNYYREKVKQ